MKRVLEARRKQTHAALRQLVRDVREGLTTITDVRDTADSSEREHREDLELALIEMKADTLNRIDEALLRVHEGTYGRCVNCGTAIPERRLRAMPFAARCKGCEEAREGMATAALRRAEWSDRFRQTRDAE